MPDIKDTNTAIRAGILTASDNMAIQYFQDGLLIFDMDGIINYCGEYNEDLYSQNVNLDYTGSIIIPGLIDIHTHLPQYPARGNFSGELLDWLDNVIFPLESRFCDPAYAEMVAKGYFEKLISAGTTTAAIYSSHFFEATDIAFSLAELYGIRAFIGNTMMDSGSKLLAGNMNDIINDSLKLIKKYHNSSRNVNYILTPRYAGSCSMELMKKCADMAAEFNLPVQTHIAENKSEIEFIGSLFPEFDDYLSVYEEAGLLDSRIIFAHCIYLSDIELLKLRLNNAAIAHCPASNRFLKSGIMPLRKYLDKGFRIGLGTDIAGGYHISVLDEAREAIESSKYYSLFIDSGSEPITTSEALYLATLGGADCLGIKDKTGSLEKGKEADFVIINIENKFNSGSVEALLNNLFYACDDRQILETWVKGVKIRPNSH